LEALRKAVDANLAFHNEEQINIIEAGVGDPSAVAPNRLALVLTRLVTGLGIGSLLVVIRLWVLGLTDPAFDLVRFGFEGS
jgi:hypothetical protein